MSTTDSQSPQSCKYLASLERMLELAQQTAEAASAEGNHKVVIQAIREVTRIVTLIHKIATTSVPETASLPLTPMLEKALVTPGNPKPPLPGDGDPKKSLHPGQKTNNPKKPRHGKWLTALTDIRLDGDILATIGSGR